MWAQFLPFSDAFASMVYVPVVFGRLSLNGPSWSFLPIFPQPKGSRRPSNVKETTQSLQNPSGQRNAYICLFLLNIYSGHNYRLLFEHVVEIHARLEVGHLTGGAYTCKEACGRPKFHGQISSFMFRMPLTRKLPIRLDFENIIISLRVSPRKIGANEVHW